MAIRNIPAKNICTCDRCGSEEETSGTAHDARPPSWVWLRLDRPLMVSHPNTGEPIHGRNANQSWLFCPMCIGAVIENINAPPEEAVDK